MSRHNAVLLLEALLMGLEVKTQGYIFALDSAYQLINVIHPPDAETWQIRCFADSIEDFIAWGEGMSEYEVDVMIANIGLNRYKEAR